MPSSLLLAVCRVVVGGLRAVAKRGLLRLWPWLSSMAGRQVTKGVVPAAAAGGVDVDVDVDVNVDGLGCHSAALSRWKGRGIVFAAACRLCVCVGGWVEGRSVAGRERGWAVCFGGSSLSHRRPKQSRGALAGCTPPMVDLSRSPGWTHQHKVHNSPRANACLASLSKRRHAAVGLLGVGCRCL